jgi:hypothetical protein
MTATLCRCLGVIAATGRQTTGTELPSNARLCRIQVHQGRVRARKIPSHAKREPAGLASLVAIASIVTRNHLPGHPSHGTDRRHVAGLLADAIIIIAGALVALVTLNARLRAAEAAGAGH